MVGSPDGDSACIRLEPFGLWITRSGLLGTLGDWGFNTKHKKSIQKCIFFYLMLQSHTERKVICHLVKCGLRHVIQNIPIRHICFWCVVLKYCVKNTVQLCDCYHEFHFFFTKSGLYVILFSVVHNIAQCTLPPPLHFLLYFPYIFAPQETHYLGHNGKTICQVSCQ